MSVGSRTLVELPRPYVSRLMWTMSSSLNPPFDPLLLLYAVTLRLEYSCSYKVRFYPAVLCFNLPNKYTDLSFIDSAT